MAHYKRMVGEKVYLSPISTEDMDLFMKWVNDPEIGHTTTFHSRVISLTQEVEFVDSMAKGGNTFSIVTLDGDRVIGNCSFFRVDNINRSAEVGIMIGEKDLQGKGYGTDALRLLVKFGFENRNYNSIFLRVNAYNTRGIACYERVGFKKQGVHRQAIIRGNRKYDMIYMDILADEYLSSLS